ncbi:PAS domain-containing protein [Haliangium sp.]|uniref:PAS domain-containing protein n=1 Tax=Haliangium sp. TaxID=2663208 RepID=UPI003D0A5BB1
MPHPEGVDDPPRLLVVDDNPSIHRDFREILTPRRLQGDDGIHELEVELFGEQASTSGVDEVLKVEIDSALQGEDAVEMAARARSESHPYFMAFVDVRMPPGIDGIETIKRLWAIDPGLSIVICTAYSDYTWKGITRALGPSPDLLILRKPFESIEVRQLALATLTRLQRTQAARSARAISSRDAGGLDARSLTAVLDSVSDGVAFLDDTGTILQINPAGRVLLFSARQGLGVGVPSVAYKALQHAVRRFARSDAAVMRAPLETLEVWSEGGESSRIELQLHRVATPVGQASRFVCVFRESRPPSGGD